MEKYSIFQNSGISTNREYMIRSLFLILTIFAVNANSFAFEVDGISYYITNSETKEVSVRGLSESNTSTEIIIPSTVVDSNVTYSVTSIDYKAFMGKKNLVSIVLPNSIVSIPNTSFWGCSSLVSFTIPNKVTAIGQFVFEGCSSLVSITIPNSVTSIDSFAFKDCSSLTSVSIPNSVTTIAESAFANCSGLTSITIPNSVTTIEKNAFRFCTNLTSVTIPNSVISIKKNAFQNCTKLTSVSIPNSVSLIEEDAFSSCENLESITLPNSLTSIESHAFAYCPKLIFVKSEITQPFEISNNVFGYSKDRVLQVPKGTKSSYLQLSGWSNSFKTIIEEGVNYYDLTINKIGDGFGSITYNNQSFTSGSKTFSNIEEGSTVSISISSWYGSEIKSVKVNAVDVTSQISNESITVTINSNTTIDVEFEKKTTWSFSITASGNGSVTYGSESIRETTKSYTLESGTNVTVTFNPDNGYQIKSVKLYNLDISNQISNNTYTVTINSDVPLEVEFEATPVDPTPVITTYSLSIKASGNGSILYGDETIRETTKSYTLNSGASATILFNPDNGYQIKSVKVNGSDASVGSSFSTTINSNTAIEVEFEANATPTPSPTPSPSPTPEGTYTLAITVSSGGNASYQGETIKNGTKSYLLTKGTEVSISFNADAGNRIKRVSQNNEDITAKINNYRYSFSITSNTTITVDFEELENTIVVNGINYLVESYDQHYVKVNEGNYTKMLNVPEKVNAQNQEWTVVGIIKEALDKCEDLAAIIWNPSYKFDARVPNPNLLLYVKSTDYAPSSVNNVIVNGTAKDITLTDAHGGNDFFCPQAFTAEKISYTHRYGMKTGIGESRGWETIALPFDVQQITLLEKEIKPFAAWRSGDAARPFWLYQFGSKGFAEAESIKAYTPYIISLPNNEKYIADYRLAGSVKFSAENVEIKNSDNVNVPSYNGRRFVPNFATQEANAGLYALNVNNEYETYQGGEAEGSKFVLNLRQIHPFEAYMTTAAGTRSIELFDQMTTAIKDNWMVDNYPDVIRVYDLSGKMVGQGSSIEEIKRALPAGVYIVNHQKIIIK